VGQGGAGCEREAKQMNIDKLRLEIAEDEGCKYEIYLDHLGLPTTGIGHLIVEDDPEYGQPVGTQVTAERVNQLFKLDIAVTVEDCNIIYPDFDELPEDAQLVIANMCFQLGRPRLSKFVGMKAGVDARDWQKAADEMVDSKWYKQTPNRAKRLVERMRGLADG
jgi:GH24 family phage-related lysozyme (muramidase)